MLRVETAWRANQSQPRFNSHYYFFYYYFFLIASTRPYIGIGIGIGTEIKILPRKKAEILLPIH